MSKYGLYLVLGALTLTLSTPSLSWAAPPTERSAQPPSVKRQGERPPQRHKGGLEARLRRSLTKELGLTAEQVERAKPMIAKYAQRQQELRRERREGFEKLLTPEQKAQLEAKRQARRERKAANAPTERKRPERAVQAGPKLELSAAQKESLGKLRQEQKAENEQAWTNFKAELGSILDDSQRAKLDKVEARQLMRGPRRGGSKEGRPGREKRPAAPTPSAK